LVDFVSARPAANSSVLKWGRKIYLSAFKHGDILLHHPYDDFEIIVVSLKKAARDPHVTRITHTLYRTSRESPIMEALKRALEMEKKVTVYIEIKNQVLTSSTI